MTTALGYNNQIEASSVSGTGWNTDFPVENVQTRYQGHRAKADGTSATITVSGAEFQTVGIAGNLSRTGTVRFQAGSFDSGAISAHAFYFPDPVTSVTITIDDPANPEGFVAVGRVFVGPVWIPESCVDWGYNIGSETQTEVATSLGGVEFFKVKRKRRVWSGKWSWLSESEAFNGLLVIQNLSDVWREIVFILDTAAPKYDSAFVARFRELSGIEHPYPLHYATAVTVQEYLA